MTNETGKRYTEKEFCEMFGIDRATAFRWRRSGVVGFIRLPTGQVRYLQSHVDKLDKDGVKRAEKERRAA